MGFIEQFEKLRLNVPRLTLMNFQATRSPYCNYTFNCEDCYYSTGSDYLKSSHYNYWGYHNTNCLDCSYSRGCEDSYECIDSKNCFNSSYLQDCEDCGNCSYCFDCQNLKDCFACIGLWRKQYYIYNKPYPKEKYLETIDKLKKKSPEELRKLFKEVKKNRPHVAMRENHNEGICTGDYVYNSSNSQFCFDSEHCRDSSYLNNAINCYDCMDISFAGEPPLQSCYEIMSGMGLTDSVFCSTCWHGKNLEYCEYCFECEYCFGCVGLKKRKFYILNVAYSPDEYFKKIDEIKKSMKEEGTYGRWFNSAYPLEDTLVAEEAETVSHRLNEKPLTESEWVLL